MSFEALKHVAELTGLSPNAKLVLFQIASFHNHKTGQCNPGPDKIAIYTGLPPVQVRKITAELLKAGIIRRGMAGYEFDTTAPDGDRRELPADWWPSEEAMTLLCRSYPNHHFDMEDAVETFRSYCQSIGRHPADPDRDFVQNISALLANRRTGQVALHGERAGNADTSLLAHIGRRALR